MIKVKVTAEHIKNGKPKDSCECPIALALKELGYKYVEVGNDAIQIGESWDDYDSYYSPIEIRAFIAWFDLGNNIDPIEFELGNPYKHVSDDFQGGVSL